MKSYYSILSLCLLGAVVTIATPVLAQDERKLDPATQAVKIQNSRTGATLKLNTLVKALNSSDVVFLGEQHDNDSCHEFQLHVIEGLVEAGHSVAISMEQFERDVQGALNDYLSGRLAEEEFLKASRPWENYAEHYRPVIEFAKEKRIDVLAANIPRRVATNVSQGQRPSIEGQVYLPRQTFIDKNAYWEQFKATMEGHVGTESGSKLEQYFASQCLKDDAMAESISDFLAINSHQRKIVVHLCGQFHSDYGLGTVARVLRRRPLARVTVITMESSDNAKDEKTLSNLTASSHFTCWTIQNQKEDTATQDNGMQANGE